MPPKVRVMGICGSLEKNNRTMTALKTALRGAADAGADTDVIDLRTLALPILGSPFTHPTSDADVQKLKLAIRGADAILLCSPEYHGSMSGALKNALDWTGFEEFEGKMTGLIGIAGGAMGATETLTHLRAVCRQLHAWVIPEQVSIANSKAMLDGEKVNDPAIEERLRNLGKQAARFAFLHQYSKADEFVKQWEQSVANPGGEGR